VFDLAQAVLLCDVAWFGIHLFLAYLPIFYVICGL
jgi:hypothetical protein